jgi:DNA polymerase-4
VDSEGAVAAGHRTILHVDMDAFYAAVEILDEPSLAGRAVIVGGTGRRGVVASCSYEARAFGVRSAMPSVRARQLCPHAVFLAGRFGRYADVSRAIHAIFEEYTPLVEGISLDEAFLDVTGSARLFGSGPEIAAAIRTRVTGELGLSCSVGVAPSKFLAKLGSEAAKPKADRRGIIAGAGVVVVVPGEELVFLHPLPIEALWGVGPATAARIRRLGVTTVGELADIPEDTLINAIGRAHGTHLARLSAGIDERPVEPDRDVKSISHEETYPVDLYGRSELDAEIVRMADAVATRLRRAGLAGRTVTLKVRFGDFVTKTRSRTAAVALAEGPPIAVLARALLDEVDLTQGVRLLGVGISNLGPESKREAEQLTLAFDVGSWRDASDAVDEVRRRFGDAAVGPASILGGDGLRVKQPGDTQWGPGAQ